MASKPTPGASKPGASTAPKPGGATARKPGATTAPKPGESPPTKPGSSSAPKAVDSTAPKPGAAAPKAGAQNVPKSAVSAAPKPGASSGPKSKPDGATQPVLKAGAPKTADGEGKVREARSRKPGSSAMPPLPAAPAAAALTTPTDSQIVQPATGAPGENVKHAQEQMLTRKDIIVIAALWSLEVVYTLTESLKSSFLLEENEAPISVEKEMRKISFLVSKQAIRIFLLVVTLLAVGVVAFFTDGKEKFTYLFSGLCIYLVTPFIGLMATNLNMVGFIDLLLLLQFGWTSVSALRYWLIFHQKSPLSVIQTRSIVTYNELFIDLTDYITAVWVTLKPFSPMAYNIVWSLVLILMLIWLGTIFFVKRWLNKADDKIEIDRKVYEDNKMADSFNSRQTTQHLVLFMCLIFPSIMFSMQKATVSYIFRMLRHELPLFAQYRIDLVILLVCLPIVAGLLITLLAVRQEMRDLFVIGIAHFSNILVCVFFLVQIMINQGSSSYQQTVNRAAHIDYEVPLRLPHDTVFTIFIYTDEIYSNFTIKHTNADKTYKGYNEENFAVVHASNGSTIKISGEFSNGTVILDQSMTVTQNKAYYFNQGNLTEIENFCKFFKAMPSPEPAVLWLVSGLEPCNTGKRHDDKGTRCDFNSSCHSVRLSLSLVDMKTKEPWLEPTSLEIPLLGEDSRRMIPIDSNGTLQFNMTMVVDDVEKTTSAVNITKKERDDRPFLILATIIKSKDNQPYLSTEIWLMARYVYDDPPAPPDNSSWPSGHETSITSALCVASVAIGVASASYIHFIWIQCPSKHRILILAAFFGGNYFGSWFPFMLLSGLKMAEFVILLSCQVLGGVWHVTASFLFRRKLRKLNEEEKGKTKKMQF